MSLVEERLDAVRRVPLAALPTPVQDTPRLAAASGRCSGTPSGPTRGTGIVILTNGLGGGALWTRLAAATGDL